MRSVCVERMVLLKSKILQQVRTRVKSRLTTGTIVLFTATIVVAGMYLAISMKVARIGREVIRLEEQKQELARSNNELAAKLASETSPYELWLRAEALGYIPVDSDEVEYIEVAGYFEEENFIAPLPSSSAEEGESVISPAYTESLIDWFGRWMGLEIKQQ